MTLGDVVQKFFKDTSWATWSPLSTVCTTLSSPILLAECGRFWAEEKFQGVLAILPRLSVLAAPSIFVARAPKSTLCAKL